MSLNSGFEIYCFLNLNQPGIILSIILIGCQMPALKSQTGVSGPLESRLPPSPTDCPSLERLPAFAKASADKTADKKGARTFFVIADRIVRGFKKKKSFASFGAPGSLADLMI